MPRCPNCGQETERTEDWACRWCGYPLLSNSFRKIPKTYKQLRDEELCQSTGDTTETDLKAVIESEGKAELELEPESIVEVTGDTTETDLKAVIESEGKAEPELEPESIVEVTAEELFYAFETEGSAADERFSNKTIRVTGIVDKIVISQYYIDLTTAEEQRLGDIQCWFSKDDVPELNRLKIGDTVIVEGKYGGFVTGVILEGCELVH